MQQQQHSNGGSGKHTCNERAHSTPANANALSRFPISYHLCDHLFRALRSLLLLLPLLAMAIALKWVSECMYAVCSLCPIAAVWARMFSLVLTVCNYSISSWSLSKYWIYACMCAFVLASLSLYALRMAWVWVCVCSMHVVKRMWLCVHGLFSHDWVLRYFSLFRLFFFYDTFHDSMCLEPLLSKPVSVL